MDAAMTPEQISERLTEEMEKWGEAETIEELGQMYDRRTPLADLGVKPEAIPAIEMARAAGWMLAMQAVAFRVPKEHAEFFRNL